MAEVDWHAYFEHIKSVCPWSWSAWNRGEVDIVRWKQQIASLDHYQARIHLAPNHSRRMLKNITGHLNESYPEWEWLWSEPSYGVYATPVRCIIQQDAQTLDTIRKNREKNKSKN